jgi:hypothetical protein
MAQQPRNGVSLAINEMFQAGDASIQTLGGVSFVRAGLTPTLAEARGHLQGPEEGECPLTTQITIILKCIVHRITGSKNWEDSSL